MHDITTILNFVSEKTGLKNVAPTNDIVEDIGCDGDDFHELIEEYAKMFNVNMTTYLWYFHACEEGNSFGSAFFKAPNERVKRISVTPAMLLAFANSGKWDIQYPAHVIPKRRYDIIVNQILVVIFITVLIYWYFKN